MENALPTLYLQPSPHPQRNNTHEANTVNPAETLKPSSSPVEIYYPHEISVAKWASKAEAVANDMWMEMPFFTSNFALDWKIVWALWHNCAKAALRAVIFCRPSNVISHWSGSISPRRRSKSTNALSNSFSNISSHRNDKVDAILPMCSFSTELCLV